MILPTVVYVLCALTSIACAALLVRGWLRSRSPLLLWSSVCFVGLAINNVLLVVDLLLVPDVDLVLVRTIAAATGMFALVYGLVRES